MKMKFKTEIQIPPFDFKVSHRDKIMMIGSCFAENISKKLKSSGFCTYTNPSGVLYNPESVSKAIQTIFFSKKYAISDLFEYNGFYYSFDHHSKFSGENPEECVRKINEEVEFAHAFFKEASILVISLGTSFVYRLKSTGEIVSNCHKLPEKTFDRERLNTNEIVESWNRLISLCKKLNPTLKILFTVSPIRHWKDGAHENQLSKSILLLAVDELVKRNNRCYYFPSYEIMMDDLRDYRFYAEDMLHPSDLAIDYIWEKFADSFFDKKTISLIGEWQKIQQALAHKPFNPDSMSYKEFLYQTEEKLKDFLNNNNDFVQ